MKVTLPPNTSSTAIAVPLPRLGKAKKESPLHSEQFLKAPFLGEAIVTTYFPAGVFILRLRFLKGKRVWGEGKLLARSFPSPHGLFFLFKTHPTALARYHSPFCFWSFTRWVMVSEPSVAETVT